MIVQFCQHGAPLVRQKSRMVYLDGDHQRYHLSPPLKMSIYGGTMRLGQYKTITTLH